MKKINATFILILAALRTTSWAFEFIQQPGKRLEVLEGSAISLMYKASAYWEHCTFQVGFCGQFSMNPKSCWLEILTKLAQMPTQSIRCAQQYHPALKVQAGVGFSGKEICKIEWRRNEWNVTLNSCDSRATFIGDYNQFECGIELSDVTVQEAGLWSCHMEAYQV